MDTVFYSCITLTGNENLRGVLTVEGQMALHVTPNSADSRATA